MREDAEIGVYIDMKQALKDGMLFYKTATDIIVTKGVNGVIDPKYILKIKNLRSGQRL